MFLKYLPLVGALGIAFPAAAITVNMTNFRLGTASSVTMSGNSGSPSYSGAAGEFQGTTTLTTTQLSLLSRSAAAAPTSFVAWCAELTQSFSFGTPYEYLQVPGNSYFSPDKVADLSRLFTAAQGFVVDPDSSAAMQAGIWEIIYEQDPTYSFDTGTLRGAPNNAGGQPEFDTVDGFLMNLASYQPDYQIQVLTSGEHQDFLVATIPEPETWALLIAGFGALGFLKRRRKAA
ncbi:MAG: PEPxxWA-CTERM sorting domain-containing protein [Caldimonas sp.]